MISTRTMSSDEATRATPQRRGASGVGVVRRFARMAPLGVIAAGVLLIMVLVAVFAPQIAPYDPLKTDYSATQQAPTWQHLLGTDHLGRDVLSRIIYGTRITLLVSLMSVGLAVSIGLVWGVVSAYSGNRIDMISQRVLEVLMSFPALILAMLLMVSLGSGLMTVIVAIGIAQIPFATRITRSVVLTVKESAYVEAARCAGASSGRIMLRHVSPQCVAPMLVVATVNLGSAIFAEAALSFLGVGVPPPAPSWGSMLGGVLAQSFNPPWWLVLFPGLAIALTVMAANLFGDGLRDFLDPRVRQR